MATVPAEEPTFIAAALAGMIAYGVMSLVMTATPIAMLDCGHEFAAAAFVIQWHSLGMFAPSFGGAPRRERHSDATPCRARVNRSAT